MALQDSHAEPSMEEILASIRRIISEDEAAPAQDDILELSQPAPQRDSGGDDKNDLLIFDREDTVDEWAAPEPEPEPAPAPPPRAEAPRVSPVDVDPEPLTSDSAVSAAAGAFTRLAGSIRISQAPGQTLEGVVRELLRPMLRDWLDQNLPAIVESKVEAELDRISRLSR